MIGQDAARPGGTQDALIDATDYDAAVASARPRGNLAGIASNDKAIVCQLGGFLLHPAGVKQACLQTDQESA